MSEKRWRELLVKFQDANAEYGRTAFSLIAYTLEEVRNAPDEFASRRRVGFVRLSQDRRDGFVLYASGLSRHEEAFNQFMELAKQAGASLPLRIREQIPVLPEDRDPVSCWLSALWHLEPPTAHNLNPQPTRRGSMYRISWKNVWYTSGDVIEKYLLTQLEHSTDLPTTAALTIPSLNEDSHASPADELSEEIAPLAPTTPDAEKPANTSKGLRFTLPLDKSKALDLLQRLVGNELSSKDSSDLPEPTPPEDVQNEDGEGQDATVAAKSADALGASTDESDDNALLSPADIAKKFGLNQEALRKRLERLRKTIHNCYVEIAPSERGPREPRYLYRLGAVRPIIEDMKASGETSGEKKLTPDNPLS